ncbi:MAG: DUF2304 domain-containing protein [Candidatus Binatia bacterium]
MQAYAYSQMYILRVLAVAFSLTLIAFIVEAIRRNRLNERYAILWLGAGAALLGLSLYRPLLDWIAVRLGVSYPPSLLFLVAFVFLLGIVLHYSLVLSSHRDSIRRLAQSVALLERALQERSTPPLAR